MKRTCLSNAVVAAFAFAAPLGHAKDKPEPCAGGLFFLGPTQDQTRSVWLSATKDAGDYQLTVPGQTIDTWSRTRRAARLTVSPVVHNGTPGEHTLSNLTAGCTIASIKQNQGGVFPSLPNRPPNIKPPFGRPSPPGLMPTVPIKPSPPIGTLPPSPPPTGVMPTVPIQPSPPIGTLPPSPPPTGVMPTVPIQPSPPIGTLPPSPPPTGVMPTVPVQPSPPIGTLPPGVAGTQSAPGDLMPGRESPFTPGRRFALAPQWNVWVDGTATGTTDRRYGLDMKSEAGSLTIGADRRVRESLVVGVMALVEQNRSDGFDDELSVRQDGFSVGPYLAYRLSAAWTVDASLTVGRLESDERVVVLNGSYSSEKVALSMAATGDYALGEARLYPRLSVSYTTFRNEAHDMAGTVAGAPLSVRVEESNLDFGVMEANVELTRGYRALGGVWYPFAEVGLRYEFERPNDGKILTGNLTLQDTSPWSGSVRLGVRTLLSRQMFVEAGLGYLSLGQHDLDVVEGRVFLSLAF